MFPNALLAALVVVQCIFTITPVEVPSIFMCPKNEADKSEPTDCSFQIPNTTVNSCLIYPTEVCRSRSYNVAHPPKKLLHESEAPFSIGLQPFIYHKSSALNITLKTSHSDVTGFVVMLQQSVPKYNNCRIFDFSAVRKVRPHLSISLYYDCYPYLEADGDLQYNLIVRSLPNNEELNYTILIQKFSDEVTEKRSDCPKDNGYIHVLFMNKGELIKNRAVVRLTQPPSSNATGKRVVITSNTGFKKVADLSSSPNMQDTLTATFEGLSNGKYSITPEFDHWSNCTFWHSMVFILPLDDGDEKPLWIFITIVCGVVAAGLLIIVLLGSLCYHFHKPDAVEGSGILLNPKALILYSYDCQKHYNVVLKFANHLKTRCKVDITLDEEDCIRKCPSTWLFTAIEENSLIILVLSKGVHHKCTTKNKPEMKEGTTNLDLFTGAIDPLCNKLKKSGNTTRLVKVLFEYGIRIVEPDCFKNHGDRVFVLPGELTPFLCELHGKKRTGFPIRVYPRMPGDNLEQSCEGRALSEAVAEMQVFQKQNRNWFRKMLVEEGEEVLPSSSDTSKPLLLSSQVKVEIKDS